MKHCPRCNTDKPLEEFTKNKRRADGLSGWCKACSYEATQTWKHSNQELLRESDSRYGKSEAGRAANKRRLAKRKLRPDFKIMNTIRSARYRTRKIRRTPAWLTSEDQDGIRYHYSLAAFFTWLSGGFVRYDVDHIIPLSGASVSGLHVPWNLQILRCDLNQSKGNRIEQT